MYGGVWIFIKTIIFASFVMTCIKKQNKKKYNKICLIYSISLFCNCTKSGLTTE